MLSAVAFDHGNTLAEFRWDDGLWRQGVGAMLAVAGGGPAQIGSAAAGLRRRFDRRDPADLTELDYPGVVAEVLIELGLTAPPKLVRRCIEAETGQWAPARHVHPQVLALLDGVRALGLRCAVVADTFDPPGLFRADLAAQGIAERVDAIVLSSELGFRSPRPQVYRPFSTPSAPNRARSCSWEIGSSRTSSVPPRRGCSSVLPRGTGWIRETTRRPAAHVRNRSMCWGNSRGLCEFR